MRKDDLQLIKGVPACIVQMERGDSRGREKRVVELRRVEVVIWEMSTGNHTQSGGVLHHSGMAWVLIKRKDKNQP